MQGESREEIEAPPKIAIYKPAIPPEDSMKKVR